MLMRPTVSRLVAGVAVLALLTSACGQDSPTRPTFATPSGPLSVASVVPTTGLVDVASNVVITGTGFQSGATVTFGGVPGKTTVLTSTTITMQAPARSEGAVDIIVSNPGGQSVTLIHAVHLRADGRDERAA